MQMITYKCESELKRAQIYTQKIGKEHYHFLYFIYGTCYFLFE